MSAKTFNDLTAIEAITWFAETTADLDNHENGPYALAWLLNLGITDLDTLARLLDDDHMWPIAEVMRTDLRPTVEQLLALDRLPVRVITEDPDNLPDWIAFVDDVRDADEETVESFLDLGRGPHFARTLLRALDAHRYNYEGRPYGDDYQHYDLTQPIAEVLADVEVNLIARVAEDYAALGVDRKTARTLLAEHVVPATLATLLARGATVTNATDYSRRIPRAFLNAWAADQDAEGWDLTLDQAVAFAADLAPEVRDRLRYTLGNGQTLRQVDALPLDLAVEVAQMGLTDEQVVRFKAWGKKDSRLSSWGSHALYADDVRRMLALLDRGVHPSHLVEYAACGLIGFDEVAVAYDAGVTPARAATLRARYGTQVGRGKTLPHLAALLHFHQEDLARAEQEATA